jgi:hypothetical protein
MVGRPVVVVVAVVLFYQGATRIGGELAIGTAKLLAEPIGLRALFFMAFLLDDIDQRVRSS